MTKKKVTAAGGILFREISGTGGPEIVMIYRWDKWDLPKGKCEKGETVSDCARREVSEELGILLPEIETELGSSYHEYERNGKLWEKTTFWFAMPSDVQQFQPQTEEDIEQARWVSLSEAFEIIGYDTLKPVLVRLKAWLEKT